MSAEAIIGQRCILVDNGLCNQDALGLCGEVRVITALQPGLRHSASFVPSVGEGNTQICPVAMDHFLTVVDELNPGTRFSIVVEKPAQQGGFQSRVSLRVDMKTLVEINGGEFIDNR